MTKYAHIKTFFQMSMVSSKSFPFSLLDNVCKIRIWAINIQTKITTTRQTIMFIYSYHYHFHSSLYMCMLLVLLITFIVTCLYFYWSNLLNHHLGHQLFIDSIFIFNSYCLYLFVFDIIAVLVFIYFIFIFIQIAWGHFLFGCNIVCACHWTMICHCDMCTFTLEHWELYLVETLNNRLQHELSQSNAWQHNKLRPTYFILFYLLHSQNHIKQRQNNKQHKKTRTYH